MTESKERIGNFTSSEIVALTKLAKNQKDFGAPALTYIDECNMERRLGRSLTDEATARPLSWGKLLEKRVHDLLGMEYQYCSSETMVHPQFGMWAGSPDHVKYDEGKTVVDVKCPITLKSFCKLIDRQYSVIEYCNDAINIIRAEHKDGEKYYWQLVSNACITMSKYAELIVYMPYKSELNEIRNLANDWDGPDQRKFAWINFAEDNELPYLNDGGYYKNLNVIRFEVPEADKVLLTEKVIAASKLLIPFSVPELI